MKLAWRVALVSSFLLTSCTLFVLVHRLNPTETLQVRDVPITSYRVPEPKQALSLRFRREPAVTQERSLLSATRGTEIPMRSFREPKIDKSSADGGASNDQLTSPTIAGNVTHQQGLTVERANSTENTSAVMKVSRTLSAPIQNYQAEGKKQSEIRNVFGSQKTSNVTEVQTLANEKQSTQRYEMEAKIVRATSRLHSVNVTTETHHFQEHRSEKGGIAANQPGITPPLPGSSLTSNGERLVEFEMKKDQARQKSEAARNKIMLTIRTTMSLHKKRLPVIFDTWLTTVNASNVFLVTDGFDETYIKRTEQLGMHYIKVWCGMNYSRWSLCCKSGEEMSLMFRPEYLHYDWYCHIDDDVYLIEDNLVNLLSYFDAKNEEVYLGRAGTHWDRPHELNPNQTLLENTNASFHFAVGGMYCITRPLLERARPWLGTGNIFGDVCDQLVEPEDVTVGAVMELLLNVPLSRTKSIYPHGLVLRKAVSPALLKGQVAFAYGCGQLCDIPSYKNNAIRVPRAKFSKKEDPSMFRSLHCHLYPETDWCQVSRYTERLKAIFFPEM